MVQSKLLKIRGYFSQMIGSTVPDVKGNAKQLVKSKESEIINKTNEIHHKFKKDLRDIFSNNAKFANAFTYEAMTGVEKFGKRSPAAAQYFLVTPWTGDPADIHNAFTDKDYVKKIAGRVRPEARFK